MMIILLTFVLNILKIKIAQEHKFDRPRSYFFHPNHCSHDNGYENCDDYDVYDHGFYDDYFYWEI